MVASPDLARTRLHQHHPRQSPQPPQLLRCHGPRSNQRRSHGIGDLNWLVVWFSFVSLILGWLVDKHIFQRDWKPPASFTDIETYGCLGISRGEVGIGEQVELPCGAALPQRYQLAMVRYLLPVARRILPTRTISVGKNPAGTMLRMIVGYSWLWFIIVNHGQEPT